MRADSPLWRVLGEPAQAQEAEALEKLRTLLPDDGIARAWTNLTFTDGDGRLNEVDALILTKTGLLLVELKGWHGEITGDQSRWHHAGRVYDNPRKLANAKAKRLASVLKDLARTANLPNGAVPFVTEAVVLHGRDSQVRLDQFGAESVWALDGYNVRGLGQGKNFSDLLSRAPQRTPIDRNQANTVDRLMQAAGLMPRPRQRMIGQYPLDSGEPLGEGPGWQDFLVTHPQAKVKRRIRLFPYPKGAARDVQHAVDIRARRELQLTYGMTHPGIVGPAELLTPEEGPALVFAYDPDEVSLTAYLEANADRLTFEDRERLVQDLAELVRFAHGQRLTHRALSPLSVRVRATEGAAPILRIRDWDLARRPDGGTTTSTEISRGVTDVVGQVEQEALLFLAPETLRGATPASAQTLDVYGVGALAALILTGKPPAANVAALQELVNSDAPGVDPRAVMPELADEYANVILEATAFQEGLRTLDIGEFVFQFEAARTSVRQQVRGTEPEVAQVDPLDAAVGDIVGERFEIIKRRGSGSTGVALEVTDYDRGFEHVILKLAKDDAAASRLSVEAEVLERLDHPRIVKRLDGPLAVGTRQGLLMSDAGLETLADRIRLEGRATIEQLERYAADLFDVVAHLEENGVFHRDIKPSNLAVKPDPGTRKPHLTLFDFSLAEEPLTNIRSGSRPYLDPYLGPSRPQYDSAAERFAIAATLFELATADPIWWEQGDAPASGSDAPIVQAAMFDPAIAEGLVSFFRTALAPMSADRHPSLDAMRQAWTAALADASPGLDVEANDAKAAAATESTPLRDAGLSARALSALARLKAETVGELLGVPPMQINQIRGLGEQVRREITARIREWRHRFAATTTQHDVLAESAGRRAVEKFIATISVKQGETSEDRYKRLRKNQTLQGLTADVGRWLRELGHLATLDELARRLLREYGSTLNDPQRTEAAIAVTRAVLELDSRSREPLFVFQVTKDRSKTAIAYAPEDESGLTFDEAEEHLEALLHFGGVIDQVLADEDVVSGPRLREALLDSGAPPLRLPESRLVQLAVGLSATGRLSSMGEAYRADLDPARAVELALRGAPTRELAVQTIEQRVRARFPDVLSIPTRPALDAPVRAAMPHLEWQEAVGKYVTRAVDTMSLTYTNSATTWGRSAGDPAIAAKLIGSIRDRAALTLVVPRKQGLTMSAARLAREYGLEVVDLADVALDALKSTASAKRVDWPTVLKADGEPAESRGRANLQRLAREAITPVWAEQLASPSPTVFLNAAVLARFGLVDLIAGVTDLATPRPAARWFLLPRPLSGSRPDLDGVPMPFGADGWLELSFDVAPVAEPAETTALTSPTSTTSRKAPVK
ncbi:protein kinase domain-containing protein [Schumannella luteola]